MKLKLRRVRAFEYDLVRIMIVCNIWWVGCKVYRNPIRSFKVVAKLLRRFSNTIGSEKFVRAFKLDGRYSWDMFNPAWPSAGFNRFFKSHLLEIEPLHETELTLRRLLIAITKRCPLQCEHCSEAATLYNKDVLSYEKFIGLIEPYVEKGVGQLVYSGGEPLSRFDDLLKFLSHFKRRCN